MEKVFTWVGYAAVAYFVLYYVLYRGLVALLATRHAFACISTFKGSLWRLFAGVFIQALIDPHSYARLGKKTIWWRGLRSGERWESVRDYTDKSGWCKQIANQHLGGHRFFTVHDEANVYVSTQEWDGEWQLKARKAFVDLCERKLSALPAAGPVVYVEAYGEFNWANNPDRGFIVFLAEHFQRVVIIRNHGAREANPFWGLNCEWVEVDGETFMAFGIDTFYDNYDVEEM